MVETLKILETRLVAQKIRVEGGGGWATGHVAQPSKLQQGRGRTVASGDKVVGKRAKFPRNSNIFGLIQFNILISIITTAI